MPQAKDLELLTDAHAATQAKLRSRAVAAVYAEAIHVGMSFADAVQAAAYADLILRQAVR